MTRNVRGSRPEVSAQRLAKRMVDASPREFGLITRKCGGSGSIPETATFPQRPVETPKIVGHA